MTAVDRRQWAGGRGGQVVVGSLVALMVLCSASAFAQDRLPPIPADKLTEARKKAAAEFLVARKK